MTKRIQKTQNNKWNMEKGKAETRTQNQGVKTGPWRWSCQTENETEWNKTCPLCTHGDYVIRFQAKNVYVSFGFQLSLLARLLFSHTPQLAKQPPGDIITILVGKYEKGIDQWGRVRKKYSPSCQNRSKWRQCQTKRIKFTQWSRWSLWSRPRLPSVVFMR